MFFIRSSLYSEGAYLTKQGNLHGAACGSVQVPWVVASFATTRKIGRKDSSARVHGRTAKLFIDGFNANQAESNDGRRLAKPPLANARERRNVSAGRPMAHLSGALMRASMRTSKQVAILSTDVVRGVGAQAHHVLRRIGGHIEAASPRSPSAVMPAFSVSG